MNEGESTIYLILKSFCIERYIICNFFVSRWMDEGESTIYLILKSFCIETKWQLEMNI
jgi:hypothetical protein